jgi:hypothetical protein
VPLNLVELFDSPLQVIRALVSAETVTSAIKRKVAARNSIRESPDNSAEKHII